ncbi:hypothetical protein [Bordetella trematum]|uniref:hypothetical protein n=1 Tax=Bordetella trematum TaxID=123899 RepID=UPI003989C5A0
MTDRLEVDGYYERGGVYFWTEANQEAPDSFRGVANITMPNAAGDALLPDLKVKLPEVTRTMDEAMNAAHGYAIGLIDSGAAKTMINAYARSLP